jgi:AraC-like DNA-binding protein
MTIGGWIIGIIRALDVAGVDGASLARQASINPDTLATAGARSPLAANTRLWRLAVQATGDPCFGLRVPPHVPATGLHGLAYAMMASANLKEALERFVRYQRSIGEIATLLGFSDSSAFSRAFKRWTGASPRSRTLQRAKAN